MVWFYERSGSFVRCETRDNVTHPGMFELIVTGADGTEQVERFATAEALLRRQEELELTLLYEGWSGPFGRVI